MLFYLTILDLTKFLIERALKLSYNKFDPFIGVTKDTWNHNNFVCQNYTLNGSNNILYDVYSSIKNI